MARAYICAYFSYLETIKPLSEAERGRLFTALLEYGATGVEPELRGNERIVFPGMRAQIDRDNAIYQSKCKTNKENIGKRWENKDTTVYDRIRPDTKRTKEKKKEKEKEKDISSSPLPPSSLRPFGNDDDDLVSVVRLWEKAAGRLASPLQAEELQTLLEEHTAEQVCNAIRSAAQHNAVNLAYVKAVLSDRPKPQAEGEKEYSPEMQAWLRGESV